MELIQRNFTQLLVGHCGRTSGYLSLYPELLGIPDAPACQDPEEEGSREDEAPPFAQEIFHHDQYVCGGVLCPARPRQTAAGPPARRRRPAVHMRAMNNPDLHSPETTPVVQPSALIRLKPGESEDYPALADGSVIDRLNVTRDEREEGTYRVSVSRAVDFHALVEHDQPKLTKAQREAWLQRHSRIIDAFMGERYGADVSGHDWSSIDAEFSADIIGGAPSEEAVINAAWVGTGIVALANEEDPGTFGSENLSRLLREKVEATANIPDFWNIRDQATQLTPRSIDMMIEVRSGKRELTDAAALAIAAKMSSSGNFPALAGLIRLGFADREELRTDLRAIYARDETRGPAADRANMMFTWLEHGGDNS